MSAPQTWRGVPVYVRDFGNWQPATAPQPRSEFLRWLRWGFESFLYRTGAEIPWTPIPRSVFVPERRCYQFAPVDGTTALVMDPASWSELQEFERQQAALDDSAYGRPDFGPSG